MPACEGRPDGPCPDRRSDGKVRLSQGDLLLCEACEKFRFPNIEHGDRRPAATSRKMVETRGSKCKGDAAAESQQSATDESRSTSGDRTSRQVKESTTIAADASSSSSVPSVAPGPELIVDELLSYVSFYRNKCNVDALRRIILSFYSSSDICQSKKLLTGKFSPLLASCAFVAERRNSATRASHEAEIDDIINIFDILDLQGGLLSCKFVACNLDNLPKFGPEEINLAAVVERQLRTEATVTNMVAAVEQLATNRTSAVGCADIDATSRLVAELQQKLETFSSSVGARLDHLNVVCSSRPSLTTNCNQPLTRQSDDTDRKLNVVIFGVKEDRDVDVWHSSVKDILRFVAGHDVDVVDMFRLGRFASGSDGAPRKPRPILVKLRVFWDRRVILSKCSMLKRYSQAGVFIVPDEPIEVRRKNTFDRLKYRAQREGKRVVVTDGVLSIDDVAVFSLQSGHLHNVING